MSTIYKGHEIIFPTADNPLFRTAINNKHVSAPSLEALKKKMDAASTFEPFDAFRIDHTGQVIPVRIVGIEKDGRYGFRYVPDKGHLPVRDDLYRPERGGEVHKLRQEMFAARAAKDAAAKCEREADEALRALAFPSANKFARGDVS